MYEYQAPGKFFEMMQSYVAFSESLNLSKATEKLNLSRHTIARHIKDLQALKGQVFFEKCGKEFVLTEAGKKARKDAISLLVQTDYWLKSGNSQDAEFSKKIFSQEDDYLFIQEHPLVDVWHIAPPLISGGLKCWVNAGGQLEHRAMKKIRPYLIMFRQMDSRWLCIEVGNKASITSWLGWKWAKSAVGTFLDNSEIVSRNGRLMTGGYQHVANTGGVFYEHICARLPRENSAEPHPVNYQRLTFPLLLPSHEKILASLVARTNNISIDNVDTADIPKMPEKDLMEYFIA